MEKKIYRTVIRFEILSEEPIDESQSLESIAAECNEGAWSGRFLDGETFNESLTGMDAVRAVKAQGSDPEFFNMDMDGNDIDDDGQDRESYTDDQDRESYSEEADEDHSFRTNLPDED